MRFKSIIQDTHPTANCRLYRGLWTVFLFPYSMPFSRSHCPLVAWRKAFHLLQKSD